MSLCVYAIGSPVRARVTVTGIAGEAVTPVRAGRLAAFVGTVRRIPPPTATHLQRYDRVLRGLSRRVPALLPARYGTAVRDLEELEVILQSRAASLRRQLALVRNRVQMTVRVLDVADAGRTLSDPPSASSSDPPSGAAYLRSRARAAAQARAVPQFEPLRGAVQRWVRAERVDRHGAVATVYHLVPRGSVESYRRALVRAASRAGTRLVVSGGWPPYAFADPLG